MVNIARRNTELSGSMPRINEVSSRCVAIILAIVSPALADVSLALVVGVT